MIRKIIKGIKKALADYQSKQEQIRRNQRNKQQLKEIYEGLDKRGY